MGLVRLPRDDDSTAKSKNIPHHIVENGNVDIFETLLCNARSSPTVINDMRRFMMNHNTPKDTKVFRVEEASSKIFTSIVSERAFDKYGRPKRVRS